MNLKDIKSKINSICWSQVYPFAAWNIWINRNNNFHVKTKLNINIHNIINNTLEYVLLGPNSHHKGRTKRDSTPPRWIPPDIGFKLNIDASFNHNSRKGGMGYVIRNHLGDWIIGMSSRITSNSVQNAELLALLHGLRLAISKNFKVTNPEAELRLEAWGF